MRTGQEIVLLLGVGDAWAGKRFGAAHGLAAAESFGGKGVRRVRDRAPDR
ncbi:hypothetical protein [Streptomyces sp.]|nr:hypothetical protein [Streptomyces sp.]